MRSSATANGDRQLNVATGAGQARGRPGTLLHLCLPELAFC